MVQSCSVLVCTRNRSTAILRSLESIRLAAEASPALAMELVVVDNNSTDDTQQVVQSWMASRPSVRSRLLAEPKPGLSAARNRALAAATGEIMVFTDDDCALAPTYFDDLRRHYAADEGAIVRGGRIELGDAADLPFTIKTDNDRQRLDAGYKAPGFLHGCNMTMNRAALERIGLFDERLGAGTKMRSGEDTDYLYRAFGAGVAVEYVPDMVVYHHHGRRTSGEIQRLMEGYFFGNGALYAKYALRRPEIAKNFYWDVRNYARSGLRVTKADQSYGIDYRSVLTQNVKGAFSYWCSALKRRFPRPVQSGRIEPERGR